MVIPEPRIARSPYLVWSFVALDCTVGSRCRSLAMLQAQEEKLRDVARNSMALIRSLAKISNEFL